MFKKLINTIMVEVVNVEDGTTELQEAYILDNPDTLEELQAYFAKP